MPEASQDLFKIVDVIQLESPGNATKVAEDLFGAVDSLALLPHRFRIHKSTSLPTRIVRAMRMPPFIIYYRIRAEERWVEILTIRHGARRQPKRFKH